MVVTLARLLAGGFVLCAAMLCACDHGVTVRPGDARLGVSTPDGFSPGRWVVIEADGAFSGQNWGSPQSCNGSVTEAEARDLADAINAAGVFEASSHEANCSEVPHYTIAIEGVQGASAGLSNAFYYDACDEYRIDIFDELVDAAFAPLRRLQMTGWCPTYPAVW